MSKRIIKFSFDYSTRKKVYVKAFITSAICTTLLLGVGIVIILIVSLKPGTYYSDDVKNGLLRKGYLFGWGTGTGLTMVIVGIIWLVSKMIVFWVDLILIVLGAVLAIIMLVIFIIHSTKIEEK